MHRLCGSAEYSIGSSIVRMWLVRISLMSSMIEAIVVDFPEPVWTRDQDEATGSLGRGL